MQSRMNNENGPGIQNDSHINEIVIVAGANVL